MTSKSDYTWNGITLGLLIAWFFVDLSFKLDFIPLIAFTLIVILGRLSFK